LHVALKLLLGVTLALNDGYGFDSMLGPPQSLVFAGSDIVLCFVVARLVDACVKPRWERPVYSVMLLLLWPFLVGNFIVHDYFKAFVNRGLMEFNGAGTTEIADYARAGITRWTVLFASFALLLSLGFAIWQPRIVRSRVVAVRWLPFSLLVTALCGLFYANHLGAGQTGWIRRSPAYELIASYTTGQAHAIVRATPEQSRAFAAPRPLFGKYHTELDVSVPSQRGKNVLLVLIESLPLEQTPLGGEQSGLTVLSELAQDGISFTNFRTVFPATSRSFLTYHCGIHPAAGDATVTKYTPGYRCDSLLGPLEQAGYRTGFFTAPMFTYDNLHKAEVVKDYDVYEDFLSLHSAAGTAVDAPAVSEEVVAERVLRFTRADRARPFFATYFMYWNHSPYRLPNDDMRSLPPLERYRRTLSYLDGVLRNLLDQLRADGVLDDTVIVVAADHGEGFGLHHENRNHVGHIFEDDVRIPFLVHVPGLGRHTTERNASNVDFAPTMAALLDLPHGASWQGQDVLSTHYEPRPTLLFGRSSFATNGIVDGNYKYIEYAGSSERHLYDLAVDPTEQHNLIATDPGKAAAYRELVSRWLPVVDYRAWAVHEAAHGSSVAALPGTLQAQP
ncbi:MAG: sulfatase, partial [Myxococcaceae bacterium]|nr:sulfatase [Myxococcaceae bacterium]